MKSADRPITDMQLLVADDDRDSADALVALLQLELGCRVTTAYDGERALQLALIVRPDVLILDLNMPGLSGLEVASLAASHKDESARPLILAITGRSDLARDLAVIDVRFDRAFAKPLDHATLFATLHAHWRGEVATRAAVEFRFFDTFTQAARDVTPLLATRRQQFSFDGEGPEFTLHGDEPGMHSALYRLMCGALDLIGSGIVMFAAHSVASDKAGALTVNLAASGRLQSPEQTAEVLQRLGLAVDATVSEPSGARGTVRASGVCPNTGGRVSFISQPREGILLRLELGVQPIGSESPAHAEGARAWLIDRREIASAVLERRLQRLGWRVWRFVSITDASKRLGAFGLDDAPDLLLVSDEPAGSRSAALALRNRMPARTRCVLLVDAGSSSLRDPIKAEGCDSRVEPLSPGDLAESTRLAVSRSSSESAASKSVVPAIASRGLRDRRKVLVVDDHEVNRIVATGLLQLLGYEVASVADGLDAIEHCKHSPPDAVLMDINMRVLDGIDATRRILELQRLGKMAPFAIVAATADDAPETRARCLAAGARGYLCKPLRLESMRDELRRVGLPVAIAATKSLR